MNAPELCLPPHSIEAEQSLLGGLLLDNAAWDRIADQVSEADFYRDDHRRIFRHIARLIEAARPADVVTVYESLEKAAEAEQAGGMAYLGEIANNTPSAANIKRYAEIVRERAILRRLIGVANELLAGCFNPGVRTWQELVGAAEAAILAAMDRHAGEPASLAEAFAEAMTYIDTRGEAGGLATGFRDFDGITGGLEPGQFVIVAARPSVGKTVFGCNVADHVARTGGAVLFLTLEMTRPEIGQRILERRVMRGKAAAGDRRPEGRIGIAIDTRGIVRRDGERPLADGQIAIGEGEVVIAVAAAHRDRIDADIALRIGRGRDGEIGQRILAARSGVPVHAMRSGTKDREDWRRMAGELPAADRQRLWIDDTPAVTVSHVRAKARRLKRKAGGLDLIVIDYLQLMRGTGDNRTQEIGSISRALKTLAKELHVPIIALAQLNRSVEGRMDKRPLMSDLRDSGELEQDADIVAMLHREEIYSDQPEWQGLAEILIRKNRNGPTGDLNLNYNPEQMRFTDYNGQNVRRQIAEQNSKREHVFRGGKQAKGRGFDD